MADDPNAAPAAPAGPIDLPSIQAAIAALGLQQPAAPQPAPVDRSVVSLLGEALGGGDTGMSPAEREAAGTRALLNFGTNMMAASGPSVMPRSFGQIFGQGVGGAEQSLAGSEAVSAQRLAAQQAYQEKQQELHLEAIKTALPLLQYQYQAQLAANAAKIAGSGAPGTGIGAAGSPPSSGGIGAPVLARDPNAGTAGQQGNNPGNVSVTPGSPLPAGASAAIPVAGGKYVAAFPDVPTGVAAHSDTLNGYAASGTNTIRAAVTKWVGDPNVPKATMDSYVADVAKAAGVDPDAKIDLSDPTVQRAFILAQQPHESGKAWLSPGDVDKGLALAAARRQAAAAKPGAAAPPAPYKVASAGATVPAPPATAPAAAPGGFPQGPGAQPGAGPPQQLIYPAPGAAGAAAASAIPAAPTPQAPVPTPQPTTTTPPAPTAPPQYPDIQMGDVTVSHPGDRNAFDIANRRPLPTTEDFNPDLSPAQKAAFTLKASALAQRAAGIDQQVQLLDTMQPEQKQAAAANIVQERTALAVDQANLAADQQTTAQAKAAAAAAATTKFNSEQNTEVGARYKILEDAYNAAAAKKGGFNLDLVTAAAKRAGDFNDKLLEPFQTGATQAQGILPNIDLVKQTLLSLPYRPLPQLDEATKNKLALLEPYLPKGFQDTLKASDLVNQTLGGLVSQMGGNQQTGQPGGRESAYEQFKTMLPTLTQTPEGRETAAIFVEELAKRRIAENTFLQSYAQDPAHMNPTTHVADMSHSLPDMNKTLPPMLQLPPPSYKSDLKPTDPKEAANTATYLRYYQNVPVGTQYIRYARDDEGHMHAEARTKGPPVGMQADGKTPIYAPP